MTKTGRPRIIESPAEMERFVEEYVNKCHEDNFPHPPAGQRFLDRP